MKLLTKLFTLAIVMVASVTSLFSMTELEELNLIKERYIKDLLLTHVDRADVEVYLEKFDLESGTWSDIDYDDQSPMGWKSLWHAERLSELAIYYNKYYSDQDPFSRQDIVDLMHGAWRYWFETDPFCTTNWHPNNIGAPRPLCYSFILMQDVMTPWECKRAQEVVFSKTTMFRTSTNLVWEADINLMHAFFLQDCDLARRAIEAITSTVCVVDRGTEGIQIDNSYHQHGPQQQFGNYGLGILSIGYTAYSPLLAGTSFAFGEDKIDIIVDFICDGFNWVMWRGALDVNSCGRHFSENYQRVKGDQIVACAKRFLPACNPEQRARVEDFINDNTTKDPITCLGQKSFYCSDGMYHHAPSWAASLKMSSMKCDGDGSTGEFFAPDYKIPFWASKAMETYSARIIGSEQGVDHKKGYYCADGAFYTYVDGDDYENSGVLWDWRKVPGITCYESDEPIQSYIGAIPPTKSSFVGTCTDTKSGITSMVLHRDSVMAHKSWIVTDDFALCLGSGVKDELGRATLTTSIDQKLAKGAIQYLNGGRWEELSGVNVKHDSDMRYYHDKSGYIVLDNSETESSVEMREGDWTDISESTTYRSGIVRDEMFSLFIRHKKQNDTYKYLILPARTKEEVAAFDVNSIDIYRNDTKAVIVKYKGEYYVTAFEKGTFKTPDMKFKVTTPGIFMLQPTSNGKGWSAIAHDPTMRISDDKFVDAVTIL